MGWPARTGAATGSSWREGSNCRNPLRLARRSAGQKHHYRSGLTHSAEGKTHGQDGSSHGDFVA